MAGRQASKLEKRPDLPTNRLLTPEEEAKIAAASNSGQPRKPRGPRKESWKERDKKPKPNNPRRAHSQPKGEKKKKERSSPGGPGATPWATAAPQGTLHHTWRRHSCPPPGQRPGHLRAATPRGAQGSGPGVVVQCHLAQNREPRHGPLDRRGTLHLPPEEKGGKGGKKGGWAG